jgi:hypothetical protein
LILWLRIGDRPLLYTYEKRKKIYQKKELKRTTVRCSNNPKPHKAGAPIL